MRQDLKPIPGESSPAKKETIPVPRKPRQYEVGYQKPPAAGRGTYLTEEMHNAIIKGLEAGNYVTTICDSLGISRNTYYSWMRKGEPVKKFDENGDEYEEYPDTPYGRLRQAVHQAEAKAEMTAVEAIRNHFDSDWRAPAEFLSRRHPEKWNPKVQVEMSGKVQHEVTVSDQRQALYSRLDLLSIEREDDPEAIEAEIAED